MIGDKSFTNQSNIRFLFVTANTGTVFEQPDLITAWVNEFADLVRQQPSDFIGLHFQEVGGKDYERFMHILDPFIKTILQIPEIATDFTQYRLYFDSDFTSQETFTALGSAYFIRHNIPIEQWNFTSSSFETAANRQIFTGNLINAQTLRKEKFPREFFSEAKWSRKGFTQTRWSINGFTFDVVNVHLFHDASNLIAVEQSPSIYSSFRKNALEHTLRSLPLDPSETSVPYVIFGDFNFRLDTNRLLQTIVEERNASIDRIQKPDSDEVSRIILTTDENQMKLIIEKKEFNFHDDHDTYFIDNIQKCQTFDFELTPFIDQLFEYEKTFPPSYPYSEEPDVARSYLRARCPAWCDRIFLSHSFNSLIRTEINQPRYNLIGQNICMGDHKPVYLALTVHSIPGLFSLSKCLTHVSTYPCSSLAISSNCDDQTALSNLNTCDDLINSLPKNSDNQNESLVTVARENSSNIILNETPLLTNDFNLFNIHDYAIFVQSNILQPTWLSQFQPRPVKSPHNSNKLWAKVRAVTYLTRLVHRPGSWYSDDQTEISPADDDRSLSDTDEGNDLPTIELDYLNEDRRRNDLAIPLRRSFSSIDYSKNVETSSPILARSRSTTLINTPENLLDSPLSDLPPSSTTTPTPTPTSPQPPPPPSISQTSSRVYRFLHCILL